jgi:hypothetical protein
MASGIHHVLVMPSGGDPRLISQSDLLSFFWSNNQSLGEILNLPVSDLMYMKQRTLPVNLSHLIPVTMNIDQTARLGLKKMWTHGVREVAVVGQEGTIVASLAASDVRGLTRQSQWTEGIL